MTQENIPKKLLDHMRDMLRTQHYSIRLARKRHPCTERAYRPCETVAWSGCQI